MTLSPRVTAILQALLVTFLWSTSWVFIKFGLEELPALTFAGLRYTLAWLCLLPLFLRQNNKIELAPLDRRGWGLLIALGLVYYTLNQGAMFVALDYLPAVTTSLILNFTPIAVLLMSLPLLGERQTSLQRVGIAVNVIGAVVYFYPWATIGGQWFGLLVALIAMVGTALAAILGRYVNRTGDLSPLTVTTITMGVGSIVLLLIGLFIEGIPSISPTSWLIIAYLAVVNTAFAFTLWNRTLQTLTAIESSIINNTMLVQITILAILFLGETLVWWQVIGLILVGGGALVVQLQRNA